MSLHVRYFNRTNVENTNFGFVATREEIERDKVMFVFPFDSPDNVKTKVDNEKCELMFTSERILIVTLALFALIW